MTIQGGTSRNPGKCKLLYTPTNPANAVSLLKCMIASRFLYVEPYLLLLLLLLAAAVVVVAVAADGERLSLVVVPSLGRLSRIKSVKS